MKPKHCSILALVALALFTVAGAQENTSIDERDGNAEKLTSLLRERRETLRQLVKVAGDQYRIGRSSLDSVIRASDQLLKAELDLAERQDVRIGFHKQRVELLMGAEKVATTRFRTGHATQEDVLAAQAARLGAEIELLRVQSTKE